MGKLIKIGFFASLMLCALFVKSQTKAIMPLTGTPPPDLYFNTSSVSLAPNFTYTPTANQHILFSITNQSSMDSVGLGFIQAEAIKIQGQTQDSMLTALTPAQKQTTRSYLDGMGRVVQTSGVKASPLQNDLIQPFAYDSLGRQSIRYLPYAASADNLPGSYHSNALSTEQPAFYNNSSQHLIPVDGAPYNQAIFENSPAQRILKAGMVGTNFQPVAGQHYKRIRYRNNTSGDGNIPIWNPDGSFTAANYYALNSLSVLDAVDEDNTETIAFTDLSGHTILKRQLLTSGSLDTYYIYNLAGMLSYIVPPKAIVIMAGTYSLNATGVSKLIFHFVYDSKGRLIEKTVPAKGLMTIVYDPLFRPVLLQDSNMRAANKWSYIKYDVKGRAISQGIYVDATHTTRSSMQTYVSGLNYSTAWYESRGSGYSTTGYYSNTIFPTSNITPLAYAYFDDYDLEQTGSANYSYSHKGLANEDSVTTAAIRGVPTMTWQTTVGAGLSGTWLLKVAFYDKRGNGIQVQSNNHVYYIGSATVTDYATSIPDFAGVQQVSLVSKQTAVSTTTSVQTNVTYDHMYRVTAVDQYYNGSGTVNHVAAYSYNEMGQQIKKNLGGYSTGNWIQYVNMRYNIRGQLLYINNSKLANDGGVTSSESNDLFGMKLFYDQLDSKLSNTRSYSGRLSAVEWMSKDASGNSSYERAFRYYYDRVGRDTAAIYSERPTTDTTLFTNTNGWNENRITYDANGNLLTLFRDSTSQGSGGHTPIDNLAYTYDTNNPNQLQKVTDGTGAQYTNSGFRNRTGSTSSYTYDGNGNLTNEPYKGFSQISYNVLNKTDKISFTVSVNRYIDYTYDAAGNLIRKRQYDNVGGTATLLNTTDYIDGFVYTTVSSVQTLQYFGMPEGRVLNNSGTLSLEYSITDQQGNARITFDNSGTGGAAKVRQENSYYAFGLIMPGSTVTTPSNPEKRLYNGGSEWQNDFNSLPDYYQTFYRNYDAALGRFVGVDPAAEGAHSMSSYNYASDNPIMFNDPLGNFARPAPEGGLPANVIHLHNGVADQQNAASAAFDQAWASAAEASLESEGGGDDSSGGGDTGGGSVFNKVFTGVDDAINEKNHNASINNSVAYNSTLRSNAQGTYVSISWDTYSSSIYEGQKANDLNDVEIENHTIRYNLGDANPGGLGMSLSAAGLRLIMFHEVWVGGDVYTDQNGNRTIGYGHFVKKGEKFGHLTHAQALALLAKDANIAVADVNRLVKGVTLTQTEFDAIVDFEYNVGEGHFANSGLLKDLNAGNFDSIKADFMQWTDFGQPYAIRRREDDIQLFDNGIYVYR